LSRIESETGNSLPMSQKSAILYIITMNQHTASSTKPPFRIFL
jgi:hypothetical protein